MKDCLTSGDLGGLVADLWAFPHPESSPLRYRQFSWIFKSFKVLVCESIFIFGSRVCGFEKKVLSKEGFPEHCSQPALMTPPFSLLLLP